MCDEQIDERRKYLDFSSEPVLLKVKSEYEVQRIDGRKNPLDVYATYRVNFSEKSERNQLSSEYQIPGRAASMFVLRRNIVVKDAKAKTQNIFDDSRFSALIPFHMITSIAAQENRNRFETRSLGTERIRGARLDVFDITPIDVDDAFLTKPFSGSTIGPALSSE